MTIAKIPRSKIWKSMLSLQLIYKKYICTNSEGIFHHHLVHGIWAKNLGGKTLGSTTRRNYNLHITKLETQLRDIIIS